MDDIKCNHPPVSPKIAIITNFPSYHQVDLFNAIGANDQYDLKVFYLRQMPPGRQWKKRNHITHKHSFIVELKVHPHFYLNKGLFRAISAYNPDIVIITQYASIAMQLMMYWLTIKRQKWIFWSEAPGVKYTELPIVENEVWRKLLRIISLFPVQHMASQIWGIGSRATTTYATLSSKKCYNFPYYSNLDNFLDKQNEDTITPLKKLNFLFVGKLVFRKGFDLLLESLRVLSTKTTNYHLTIVGDGPMKELISKLDNHLQRHVTYVGFVEITEVPGIMKQHDVFVFPSRYDGWGMVIPEAMAAGLPVISSKAVGSAIDIIEEKKNGVLMKDNSTQDITNAMNWFIKNQNAIPLMSQYAKQSALKYSANNGASKFTKLISNSV